jgi:GT2 family glycosyltransferase
LWPALGAYRGVVSTPVYVVHWNAADWCAATVESLAASTVPVDVTVVDNSSNYEGPGVVVRPGRNLGFAGAGNLALRSAANQGAEWCVLACHDALAAPDAVEQLLAVRQSRYAVLGAVLDGAIPTWARSAAEDGVVPANSIIGTLMLLNVPAARAVGGFDERYGSYYEEVDLCHRLWIAGHRVGFATAAHVATKGASSRSAEALKNGNYVLLTLKEDGRRAALRELRQLAREALKAGTQTVLAPRNAEHRAHAMTMAHAFAVGSFKLARYWDLASIQEHEGVMPE